MSVIGVVRCLRAARGATGALALPIPHLSEDRTPLNAEPEHSVPVSFFKIKSTTGLLMTLMCVCVSE